MTRELVDYRLARYRRRFEPEAAGGAFTCKVISNQRDPILMLPPRTGRPDLPAGDADVRLPTGASWRFRFAKIACNVAHPVGASRNQLPDLLRGWFGPGAGKPGTAFRVRFFRSPDGWCVEPHGQVIELPRPGRVVAFPTLRAAAGAAAVPTAGAPEAEDVVLPVRSRAVDVFAVRATGDSMDGGATPIRDGDWLVFQYARRAGLGAVEGRVALIQIEDGSGDGAYLVKRVVRDSDRWTLRSDNPTRPSLDASERTVPIARLIEHLSPDALGPDIGARLEDGKVGGAFGLDVEPAPGRVGGHLFVMVEHRRDLVAPDRVRAAVPDRRPGETTFVLARGEPVGPWRYCGVGRWDDASGTWAIPDVDYDTWRALGEGRESSRRLGEQDLEDARKAAEAIAERFGDSWVEADGKRCRVIGRSAQGGVRIDGGPDGFKERSVSLTDLGWVIAARRDVAASGGILDEARVNRLRYLEGTPKAATRWIDTGWAMRLMGAVG